ncbi:MAG TPA: hypothetical protein VGO42_21905, partial [Reyranella sp.]|nr:hypothetical protein [Reyranella sp.]
MRAAQQLRDCLQADRRAGQFVSAGREANFDQHVIDASSACSARRREDDDVFLAREVQQDA